MAIQRLESASLEANPELLRVALKLATGAGKTTVMAMIIAWQTINAVRYPNSRRFTRGFLVVTPGLTIRDRLRVLQPNDPDSYYASRELVPTNMLGDLQRAKIVITNYHGLRPWERLSISSGARDLLQGPGEPIEILESEGQMMQRVMPELMALRNIMVLNDEGHHCYRRKPGEDDEGRLTGEDKREADRNNEEARVWICGLEMVKKKLGIRQVVDLSATPFFLRGSGYAEGTLFPWTVSDFSLTTTPLSAVSSSCRGFQLRTTFPAPTCRCSATCGSTYAARCLGSEETGRATWTGPSGPADAVADSPGSPVQALRKDLRGMGFRRDDLPTLLHRGVQQHFDLQAGLRLHFRLRARE